MRQRIMDSAGKRQPMLKPVLKTVPRPAPLPAPSGQTFILFWLCIGTCTYTLCALGLRRYCTDPKLQEELVEQVPWSIFEVPTAGFAAMLLLNLLNLGLWQHDTRFRSNTLLLFINALAFTTDLLICLKLTPVAKTSSGRLFHPLRYFQWLHSTPSLIYMMSMMSDLHEWEVAVAIVNDLGMVLTGLAATWSPSPKAQGAWGVLSFATFAVVLLYVYRMLISAIKETVDSHAKMVLWGLMGLTMVLWNSFPIVWLLSEAGFLSPIAEHLGWGLCDYTAKAVYSSQLWQSNMMSIQERRSTALKAWEDSNRVMVVSKLRNLVEAKERFVHILSQELRTPILGIMALANLLQREIQREDLTKPSVSAARHLAMIRASSSCLLNIINTTLDAAAARASSTTPAIARITAVHLGPLVQEVAALISPLFEDDVDLFIDVPVDLPPVRGERTKLMQIFFNLLGNASRFTRVGTITVSAKASDQFVEVSVTDTGMGVPTEKLETLLTPFDKVDVDIATNYDGSGLGLYLVKLILSTYGSTITVDTQLGKGTTFQFNLPLAEANTSSLPLLAPSRSASSPASQSFTKAVDPSPDAVLQRMSATPLSVFNSLSFSSSSRSSSEDSRVGSPLTSSESISLVKAVARVAYEQERAAAGMEVVSEGEGAPPLEEFSPATRFKVPHRFTNSTFLQVMTVDDDVINQVVAEQVIRSQKWRAIRAMNGKQALDYLENKADMLPDIVLLDVMMPEMDGFEVCTRLREKYPASLLPIIMVSAKTEEVDVCRALQSGADDYITKPYKRNELIDRIKAQIRARKVDSTAAIMTAAAALQAAPRVMSPSAQSAAAAAKFAAAAFKAESRPLPFLQPIPTEEMASLKASSTAAPDAAAPQQGEPLMTKPSLAPAAAAAATSGATVAGPSASLGAGAAPSPAAVPQSNGQPTRSTSSTGSSTPSRTSGEFLASRALPVPGPVGVRKAELQEAASHMVAELQAQVQLARRDAEASLQKVNNMEAENRKLQNKLIDTLVANARIVADRDLWKSMTAELRSTLDTERQRLNALIQELSTTKVQQQIGELWKVTEHIKAEMGLSLQQGGQQLLSGFSATEPILVPGAQDMGSGSTKSWPDQDGGPSSTPLAAGTSHTPPRKQSSLLNLFRSSRSKQLRIPPPSRSGSAVAESDEMPAQPVVHQQAMMVALEGSVPTIGGSAPAGSPLLTAMQQGRTSLFPSAARPTAEKAQPATVAAMAAAALKPMPAGVTGLATPSFSSGTHGMHPGLLGPWLDHTWRRHSLDNASANRRRQPWWHIATGSRSDKQPGQLQFEANDGN